jgi:hypothetical protein
MSAARVKYPACGYSIRKRKDGSPMRHRLYTGTIWICPGGTNGETGSNLLPIARWLVK